jgi:hypothetical protein
MKSYFNRLYNFSDFGFYILSPFVSVYYFFLLKKYLPRKYFIKLKFKKNFGYRLNLDNPRTLNEKLNWLILNYDNPIGNILADKYRVREYIKNKIGSEYLIPSHFVTNNPKEINHKNLPDYPIIVKTNHNSSGGVVIKDKNDISNWKHIQNKLRANLAQDYYWNSREMVYKNIKPLLIVEKLLDDGSGNFPKDYKVHCFNGKVRMINVDLDRGTENQSCNWYNTEWSKEKYDWGGRLKNGSLMTQSEIKIPKPKCLPQMIKLSEYLSSPFKYLRVDWYIINNQLFFGELTLYHHAGGKPIRPKKWDFELGKYLILEDEN